MRKLFTSESVTEGHPDKLCDQAADAILDALLEEDPYSRVACEVTATTGIVYVMGEITTKCYVDIPKIVRSTIEEIGYTNKKFGFDCSSCAVITSIDEQSSDIALGVDQALENKQGLMNDEELEAIGAGDQGMMFGYACDETEELMPMPVSLAHKLAIKLSEVRKSNVIPYLGPDGKTQVTIEYDNDKPVSVQAIVVSSQHLPEVSHDQIEKDILEKVIKPVIPENLLTKDTKYYINPTGRFVKGGPEGDSGLTGRKLIVDTYGGYARHGGGSFSGKDPTKVDRSATYFARYIAKNIVAAGLAKRCEIQIAYAIGVARPLSVMVDSDGTGVISDDKISEVIREVFDLRPGAIIQSLNLRRPIYKKTAAYGHFGREDKDFTWEKTDKTEDVKKAAAKYR